LLMNFYMICFGRFVLGFACGVILCATPIALDEVVPGPLIDKGFGSLTNIMINVSWLILMLISNFMPESKAGLQESKFWMILFAI